MLLAVLFACAPCTPFAEMRFPEDGEALAATVADFAAWTGRDGVCVPAVEWREELEEGPLAAGRYDGPGEPILLRRGAGSPSDMARTLRHELCHALDAEEGLSTVLASTLDPESIDPVAYPTEALRLAEAFAQACEAGPPPVEMPAALHRQCGLAPAARAAPLRAEVYPEAPAEAPVEVGEPPSREQPLHADGVLIDATARAESLWLLADNGEVRTIADAEGLELGGGDATVAALGPFDGVPLLVGPDGVRLAGHPDPFSAYEAWAAAGTGDEVWVASPEGLVGPSTGVAVDKPDPQLLAHDVDAQPGHVVALLASGELWVNGHSTIGLPGAETVAISPDGVLLLGWRQDSLTGAAVSGPAGWTLHTACDRRLSGAAPLWWRDEPWLAAQLAGPTLVGW